MVIVFNEGSFVEQMFTTDAHELWMRSLAVGIIVVFGIYIQLVAAKRRQVDQILRESGEQYRVLFNSGNDAVLVHRLTTDGTVGKFIEVNDVACQRLGYSREELLVLSVADIITPETLKDAPITVAKLLADKHILIETVHLAKDGRRIPVEINTRLFELNGQPTVFSIARDITERKRMEEALRRSQEKLSSFMESAPDGFALFDSGLNYIDINRILQQMIGLSKGEIIGKNILDIIPNLKQTGRYDKYMKVIKTEKPLFIDEMTPHPEFGNICLAVRAFKVGDGLGIVFTDITERKQAEEVLRQSEGKYRSLVTNVKLGIFRSTPGATGKFLEVNPATEEITGYSREELLQMNVSDLYVHPTERETVLKEAASTEGKTTRELYFRKKDGTIIAVSDTKVAVRDSEGRILFFDGILEDITKRKRAEEELRGSRKELRDLFAHLQSAREEERKRVARDVHDEMGQELAALKMDLSWLAKRFPKGQELLLDKTKSMLKRVDMTIQTVQRISAELRPVLLDDFGLAAAIEWQVGEFQELTGIRCELILNPENIIVNEDSSTAIFRIFQETLTNIARHAEATKVTVDLKERANKLVLKVSDNGRGITEKEISHPKSFGLIGMRERALVLGGEVKFLGAQDEGTTITVSIPLKKENLNAENPRC